MFPTKAKILFSSMRDKWQFCYIKKDEQKKSSQANTHKSYKTKKKNDGIKK